MNALKLRPKFDFTGGIMTIDPGPKESGWLQGRIQDGRVSLVRFGVDDNDRMIELIDEYAANSPWGAGLVYESVQSFGMAVGASVFDTCVWSGRFIESARRAGSVRAHPLTRMQVKLHLCRTAKAKDANIRQVLLDRYGGKVAAVGNKKSPGPLYKVKTHVWSALALAVTAAELREEA